MICMASSTAHRPLTEPGGGGVCVQNIEKPHWKYTVHPSIEGGRVPWTDKTSFLKGLTGCLNSEVFKNSFYKISEDFFSPISFLKTQIKTKSIFRLETLMSLIVNCNDFCHFLSKSTEVAGCHCLQLYSSQI